MVYVAGHKQLRIFGLVPGKHERRRRTEVASLAEPPAQSVRLTPATGPLYWGTARRRVKGHAAGDCDANRGFCGAGDASG